MLYSDDFIPSIKQAFGGVDYINLSDHFKQRWDERQFAQMSEEAFCKVIADAIAIKPLAERDDHFTIHDPVTLTKIACHKRPFRRPDRTGTLINMLTVYKTNRA